MPQVSNISATVQRFTDRNGKVVEIAPGESDNVDMPRDSFRVVAKERANLIRVGGTKAQAAKTAREKTPIAPAEEIKE